MAANNTAWEVSLPRKLTADETSNLKSTLRPLFKGDEEDISDLLDYTVAMVSNHKTVDYVVAELVGMEMDFCPSETANKVGSELEHYLTRLTAPAGAPEKVTPKTQEELATADTDGSSRVVSLKSSEKNALTMSGALGASRERGGVGKKEQQQSDRRDRRGDDRRGNRDRGSKQDSHRGGRSDNRPRDSRDDSQRERSRHGDQRRDVRGRAFDRLAQDRRREDRGRGPGPRGRGGRGFDDRRGGGGGRGSGRFDGRQDAGGRGRGRDGPPRSEDRTSGQRRRRDDLEEQPDYIPAARGRDGRDGGRGRGRGFDPNKRPRMEEGGYEEPYGYYEGYEQGYPSYGGHSFRGGFRGRGGPRGSRGGRFPGRGRDSEEQAPSGGQAPEGDQNDQVDGEGEEAAAYHPSPIVGAAFRGRGFRGRGRARGRGRGRFPGRAEVQSTLASMTWVRKKEGEGGDANGDKGDDGGGAGDGEAS